MPGVITGKHVLWDVSIVVNAVDLSDHAENVEFMLATNDAGSGAAMGGLKDYQLPGTIKMGNPKVTWFQDFAAAKVYATLFALLEARTIFNIVGKASSAARSTTNPEWTIPVFVGEMPLMTGTRGDRHMAPTTFTVAGEYSVLTA